MTPEHMSRIADSLYIAPHEWEDDGFRLIHEKAGIVLWVASGPAHFRDERHEHSEYRPRWWWSAAHRYLARAVRFRRHMEIEKATRRLL